MNTVLIFDHDLGFLFWLGQVLASYRVLPARSVPEAMRLIRRLRIQVDLLIVNPEISGGAELVKTLRMANPSVRVIALSGESNTGEHDLEADAIGVRPAFAFDAASDSLSMQREAEQARLQAEWLSLVEKMLSGSRTARMRFS